MDQRRELSAVEGAQLARKRSSDSGSSIVRGAALRRLAAEAGEEEEWKHEVQARIAYKYKFKRERLPLETPETETGAWRRMGTGAFNVNYRWLIPHDKQHRPANEGQCRQSRQHRCNESSPRQPVGQVADFRSMKLKLSAYSDVSASRGIVDR